MGAIERSNIIDDVGAQALFQKAGALVDGDFNGQAAPGARAVDTTNSVLYINTGTKAATVWTIVGTQA